MEATKPSLIVDGDVDGDDDDNNDDEYVLVGCYNVSTIGCSVHFDSYESMSILLPCQDKTCHTVTKQTQWSSAIFIYSNWWFLNPLEFG